MDEPKGKALTLSRRIIELAEQGWTPKEIAKELKTTPRYVRQARLRFKHKNETDRKIALMYEMVVEMYAILKALAKIPESTLEKRLRQLETLDLPKMSTKVLTSVCEP